MRNTDPALLVSIYDEITTIERGMRILLDARLPGEPSASHFAVIHRLAGGDDGGHLQDMARNAGISGAAAAGDFAALVDRGLIEIRRASEEGRPDIARLTPSGRELHAQMINALAPDIRALAAGAGGDCLRSVLPLLTGLRRLLESLRRDDPSRQPLVTSSETEASPGPADFV